jgi:hypothetical protein
MKRIVLTFCLVATAMGMWIAQAADPIPATAPSLATFMRLKLSHAQSVLEGITLEDYDEIAKHAQTMATLSEDEKWNVFQTAEYRRHSAEFQLICRSLQEAAQEKNLDGATLAYMQMTMSCVNCHKYSRNVRMASLR